MMPRVERANDSGEGLPLCFDVVSQAQELSGEATISVSVTTLQ